MQSAISDGRLCSLGALLRHQAQARGDAVFAQFETGERWTFAETLDESLRAASGLARLGVGRGDVALLYLPNGPDYLRLWFGANLLGAIVAAPNTAYRGDMLQRLAQLVGAKVAAVHAGLMAHAQALEPALAPTVIQVGGQRPLAEHLALAGAASGAEPSSFPEPPSFPELGPWDTQFVMFTSGTTGLSKGVVTPYAQAFETARAHFGGRFGMEDRYLVNLPLFHVGGLMPVIGSLMTGGSIVLTERFRTEDFWALTRRWSITGCTLLGGAANFLLQQPPREDDADNPVRTVSMLPLVGEPTAFGRRFGIDVFTAYGMSELCIPITSAMNPEDRESCGRLRDGFEARVVDIHDQEAPDGEVGELILRADRPWVFSPGYWNDADATSKAWRNGWFHTGDRFRRRPSGEYVFIDRSKDAIRRRGENISSYEVELALLAHPSIVEAAAIAVPSPYGEDDLMAVVVVRAPLDPAELLAFLAPRTAYFMLPRYVRQVAALPKTPSLRVQKHLLRAEGITADAWDREAAGIRIRRERIAGQDA